MDIDGPLHANGAVRINDVGELSGDSAFCWARPLVHLLRELPHVDVVIHSSWRLLWESDEELKARLPPELAERVVATTPRHIMSRHASIEAYCAQHKPELFVILDDESGAFPEALEHLVVCEPSTGLSDPKVIERLRRALTAG